MRTAVPAATLEKFTTFGDLLRFLRRRSGITQMELANAVGYSDAQISRLEQNLRLPDLPIIEARFVPALELEDDPPAIISLLDLAAKIRREDAPSMGLCPYKGLNYFDEADADLFVGREALTARLADITIAMADPVSKSDTRFLAVVGASGSGKSSLVRAGLIPALRWNKLSSDWYIQLLTPSAKPLESLAICLTSDHLEQTPLSATATLIDNLGADPRALHLFARRHIQNPAAHLLLVVDQFEELFTICHSEQERQAFIDSLLYAAADQDGPTLVVITLRADFYANCSGYANLREALVKKQIYIGAMSEAELIRAIEEPARRGRWNLEPGLVNLFLRDVGSEPGSLPLLSHALLETWQRRRGRLLTLGGYTASGGVRGAIAESAEAVFADRFNAQQRQIARRIFLRLTEFGGQTSRIDASSDELAFPSISASDTRRRARISELVTRLEDEPNIQSVLNTLAEKRLIVIGEDTVEVAHEALIREWPTLRGWLEENRDALRLHRHLTHSAQEWQSQAREADLLYRGARLAQAREWAQSNQDDINLLEREFLDASQSLADCERIEQEAQRQRELENAQKLVEVERRRAEEQANSVKKLRRRSMYLAAALTFVLGLGMVAGYLWRQSQTAGKLAASRELAFAANSNLEIDPERSMLLALAALDESYSLEAENALHQALIASRVRKTIFASDPGKSIQVVINPAGSIATSSDDEEVKIWDASSTKVKFSIPGSAPAFTIDGNRLATILADGSVQLWDSNTGKSISLPGHIDGGSTVSLNPDGSRLATVTSGNLPRIWELSSGKEVQNFPGHTEYISTAVFSPDGSQLLTASDDGTARVWDTVSGEELLRLSDHPGWVWTAVYSPNGKQIATASESQAALWDASTGRKLFTLIGHLNTIYSLAFSPDARYLATGSQDRKIKLWDITTGKEVLSLVGHTGAVTSLAFEPDGAFLVSGSDDGSVRFWDFSTGGEDRALMLPGGPMNHVSFSPDGSRLAIGEKNDTVMLDASTNSALTHLSIQSNTPENPNLVTDFTFSPNSRLITASGDNGMIYLWDAASGAALNQWTAHTGPINQLVFSLDGRLISASDDYKVKVWMLNTADETNHVPIEESPAVLDLSDAVKSAAVSSDGSQLAAGMENGLVRIFDLIDLEEIRTFPAHTDAVTSLAFNPDRSRLASGSNDGLVRIWNPPNDQPIAEITGHSDAVTSVEFSPDGKRLATASLDGSARLWDASDGTELLTFPGDGAALRDLDFSPDGSRIATAGDAGLRVYLLHLEDLKTLARSRLTRSLTEAECQKFLHQITSTCSKPSNLPTPTPWPSAPNGRICQVAGIGGLYDNYFNRLMYLGIQEAARKFDWKEEVLQSSSSANLEKNLQSFLGADCKLIATIGMNIDIIQRFSSAYPDQKLMITDFPLEKPSENTWTQVYATNQAAFLAGYVAASMTRNGKVGVFGGIDIPQVTDFMDGYALGVEYYNSKNGTNVVVLGWDPHKHVGLFAGGFCCSTEGRKMARQLLDEGADVILPVAGQGVGWGAGAEIQAYGSALMIGVDTDWSVTSPDLSNIVITSIEKRYDLSVLEAAKSIQEGTFKGGIHTGLLATGEVGLSPFHGLDALVSSQVKADLEKIKADIIAGVIKTSP